MIEITDETVDDAYRHGIADLVAHRPRPSTDTRQRRIPVLVAIAGIAIPLAALAAAAIFVIAGHAQLPTSPAGQSVATVPLGRTISFGSTVVPADSVTVEGVTFFGPASATKPVPVNGLYAVAAVRFSTLIDGVAQPPPAQYTQEEAALANLVQQEDTALAHNDVARTNTLRTLIAAQQLKVAQLAFSLKPFQLEYVTSDGRIYPALPPGTPPVLFAVQAGAHLDLGDGLTSFAAVFDVPSKGGVIQMTNPQGRVIGRWQTPRT